MIKIRRTAHSRVTLDAALIGATLLAVTLSSCAPKGTPIETPVVAPPAFSTSGSVPVPERWWTTFEDPSLDALVEEALRSNDGLMTVWYRLRAARAVARRAGSDLLPDVDAELGATVFRASGSGRDGEEVRLGLAAGYEIDLWGRIRASVDAEELRAEAVESDYRAAALSLAAEVARTWMQILEARQQVSLLDGQIDANSKVVQLLENRFGGGQVRGVDILRQRQLVEATREQRWVAQSRLAVLENLLAVLLGRAPRSDLSTMLTGSIAEEVTLPELPPQPATGVPSELIQRRPDVVAAYCRLLAADRDLAAAVANRYPRLNLTAALATEGGGGLDLFEDWIGSVTAGLLAPVFRAGELEAEAERVEAVKGQRLHEYAEIVLEAWREVEDALVQEASQIETISSLQTQVELSEKNYRQLQIEYLNGRRGYVDALLALSDQQRLARDLIEAQRQLLEIRIALYRALAGGFDLEPPTTGASPSRSPT